MKPIFLSMLFIFGTFPIMVNAQYIKLDGKQFIDENGDPFFPMIMNYSADVVYNGTVPSTLTTSNIKVVRSHDYGTQKWTFENNYSWADCETSLDHDFIKIAEMGFNAIRLILTPRKKANSDGFYMKIRDFTNFHYASNFIMDPTSSYTDLTSQVIFDKISLVIDKAASKGLKVIFLCANAPEDEIAPDRGSNPVAAGEYAVFLSALADHLKNKSNLLAYDIYNEPPYQHSHGMVWDKHTICDFTKQWCDAIRDSDINHLITMGSANVFDVFNWDQSIMPLDFMSMHFYPDLHYWEGYDKTIAANRVLNQIYWCTQAMQRPWIIGETGFWATPETCFVAPAVDGTLSDQSDYVDDVLTALRDCGASGFSWWEFMDHHWYCWSPNNACAVSSPPCWVCQDPYEVTNYQKGPDKIQAFHGLLNYSDPDLINGDPTKGYYDAAAEKPALNTIRLFNENNTTLCELPIDDNNDYFNPYDHPSHQNTLTGYVVDSQTGIPIENALIKATSIAYMQGTVALKSHTHFTYTNSLGHFSIIPFDIDPINPPNGINIIIDNLRVVAPGSEVKEYTTPNSNTLSNILIENNLMEYHESYTNILVLPGETRNLLGHQTLTTFGSIQYLSGSAGEIVARESVRMDSEFHAESGADVHVFTGESFPECDDFNGYRLPSISKSETHTNVSENNTIEVTFNFTKVHSAFEIYPNPNSGSFQIEITNSRQFEHFLLVHNTLGQLVYTTLCNSPIVEIILPISAKGLYFITLQSDSEIISKKVIIQ